MKPRSSSSPDRGVPKPYSWLSHFLLAVVICTLSKASAYADENTNSQAGYPGRIETMISFDVSNLIEGVIEEVHFQPGQSIQTGDVLFSIEASGYELAVETQRLNTVRADAALRSARQDLERMQKLKERGSVTDVQMFKAEIAMSIGEALLAQSKAEFEVAELELSRTVIRAPIDGIISKSDVSPGSYVEKGRGPLARIDQMDPVRLAYEIPYIERIEQLQIEDLSSPKTVLEPVTLRIKISDSWIYSETAKPENVSSRVDYTSGNLTIWAEVANPNYLLRPGMRVTVLPGRDND